MFTKDAKRKISPAYPDSWDKLSQGGRVKKELELVLAPIVERMFGYHLVKLGSLSSELELASCPINHKINVAEQPNKSLDVCGKSCQLPLQNNSVDAFVVLAELDFAIDPHQIVREINRTITADGKVVIAGFNPFSLAGILKYFPVARGNMLHQGRFFTSGRIKDWLQLLDFEIVQHEHLMYSSLFADDGIFKKSPKIQAMSRKIARWYRAYLPWSSSMYVIVARKSTIPMSTAKPIWQIHPGFKPRPAAAILRGRSHRTTNK